MRADARGCETVQRRELMEYLNRYLNFCYRHGVDGALVFDIDDTLIFARSSRSIPEVAHIFQKYSRVFPTYVVTARDEKYFAETERQLMSHGFDTYRRLFLLPRCDRDDPGKFKWRMRRLIKRQHGRILAAVGDQVWDAIPWPIPSSMRDLDQPGPRRGALLHIAPHYEVGVLLPSRE